MDPNARNSIGSKPLHDAARSGHPEVVKFLLERGVDPNLRNNDSWTPLHSAACRCHIEVVRVPLEHRADSTIRNNEGRTPLELGRKCGNFVEELMLRSSKTTVYDK
ncbi:MAG: ankyrin repeat domain-containing protein [Pyrobaculum sp.]